MVYLHLWKVKVRAHRLSGFENKAKNDALTRNQTSTELFLWKIDEQFLVKNLGCKGYFCADILRGNDLDWWRSKKVFGVPLKEILPLRKKYRCPSSLRYYEIGDFSQVVRFWLTVVTPNKATENFPRNRVQQGKISNKASRINELFSFGKLFSFENTKLFWLPSLE